MKSVDHVSADNEVNAQMMNLPWGYRVLWMMALHEPRAWRRFYFRVQLLAVHGAVVLALALGLMIGWGR